jgi:TonB-dependent SusC/RagA subfamily outer membrane receptor
MRKIFILIELISALSVKAQDTGVLLKNNVDNFPPAGKTGIIIRCSMTNTRAEPLLVIDGILYEYRFLQKLDPCDIESINILKASSATALYGCRAANGVIILTTKTSKFRKFIIKDFSNGNTIPGATVKFKLLKDKSDSFVVAANDNGVIFTEKLKPGAEYNMELSSVGFKNYCMQLKNSFSYNEQSVFMERSQSALSEVVVMAYPHLRSCRRICCSPNPVISYTYGNLKDSSVINNNLKIYPNPLARGSSLNLEITSGILPGSSVRIFSLSGALMLQQKINTDSWKKISIASDKRWAAGTYIVQVVNEAGKPAGQQKIIVQ